MGTDGDDCGTHGSRKVDVNPACGSTEALASVEEPSTCHYVMTLDSPIFCQSTNLLVYPNLKEVTRSKWDEAFTEWKNGILTTKGYVRAVFKILADAGVVNSISDGPLNSPPSTSAPAAIGERDARDSRELDHGDDFKELLGKYERLGRQHAETILELGKCQRDLRQVMGAVRSPALIETRP